VANRPVRQDPGRAINTYFKGPRADRQDRSGPRRRPSRSPCCTPTTRTERT
jgi:hypothetical protein